MPGACNFIEKETLAPQVFSCEFYKISKNTFLTEHLWTTASRYSFESLRLFIFIIFFKTNLIVRLHIL